MIMQTTANLAFSSISQHYRDVLVRWWEPYIQLTVITFSPIQAKIKESDWGQLLHKHYLLIYNWKCQPLIISLLFLNRKYRTSSVCHTSSKPTWLHRLFHPNTTHCIQEPSLDALYWREWITRAVGRLCKHPCFSNYIYFLWFIEEEF